MFELLGELVQDELVLGGLVLDELLLQVGRQKYELDLGGLLHLLGRQMYEQDWGGLVLDGLDQDELALGGPESLLQ